MGGYFDKLKSASMNSRSGGGSGTSDYDELQNKPSVNGNTLAGNKTSSQLGLQSEINLESKLDADLVSDENSTNKFTNATEKAAWNGKQDAIADLSAIRLGASAGATALQQSDVVSTYSASGVEPVNGTAINAAIGTLDVESVGGAGKVISAISETNGKISATVTTMDTVPTENSTNPVTSGGVYPVAVKAVDEGAKNKLKNSAVTQTVGEVVYTVNPDGTVSAYTTATTTASRTLIITETADNCYVNANKDVITGLPETELDVAMQYGIGASGNIANYTPDEEYHTIEVSGIIRYCLISIRTGVSIPQSSPLVFKPMICTASDWSVSQKFVPYCPTMRELYEMILALQSGVDRSLSIQSESLTKKAEQEEIKDSENGTSILYPD